MNETETSIRFALFPVGTEHYALAVEDIVELVGLHNQEGEAGYIRYKKRRIPLYNLGQLLGIKAGSDFLIIVRGKESSYGILVPEPPEFRSIGKNQILPLPDLISAKGKKLLKGVIVIGDQLYGILAPDHLRSDE
ncbi:MAG TPA: chemotaxis protein CheW [bacterium (Candidatus Stahlbacteria)]|nr:chemotaxis protein CheW [Candidatus Stahlbacteria bacterium]